MSAWFIIATLALQFGGGIFAAFEGKIAVAFLCAAGVLAQVSALMMLGAK
jgi:hypothetical protein